MRARLSIILSITSFYGFTQDIILLKTGNEINAKVIKVGVSEIEYMKDTTSPLYAIKKSEVFMIKYENGTKDVFVNLAPVAKEEIESMKANGTKNKDYDGPPTSAKGRLALHNLTEYYGYYGILKTTKHLEYNSEKYKIEVNRHFVIPVIKVRLSWVEIAGEEQGKTRQIVKLECLDKGCVYVKESSSNRDGIFLEFKTKEQCMKFIILFSDFTFAIEAEQKQGNRY